MLKEFMGKLKAAANPANLVVMLIVVVGVLALLKFAAKYNSGVAKIREAAI
jgi:hypothetical protein